MVRLRLMCISVAVYFVTLGGASAGTVVFIDLNGSFDEVASAREAARVTGQDFVVFPDIPDDTRQHIELVSAALEKFGSLHGDRIDWLAAKRTDPKTGGKIKNFPPELEAEYQSLTKQEDELFERSAAAGKPWRFDSEKVAEFFDRLTQANQRVTSLILSGHSGEGTPMFSGALTIRGPIIDSLSLDGMREIVLANPRLFKDLQSVYLWGCYSGAPARMQFWTEVFPGLHLLGGFTRRSPGAYHAEGYGLLGELLRAEPRLLAANSPRELARIYTSLGAAKEAHLSLIKDGEFIDEKGARPVAQAMMSCKEAVVLRDLLTEEYEGYYQGYSVIQDIAPDKQTHFRKLPDPNDEKSALRRLLALLHDSTHCGTSKDAPTAEQVLRLTYFLQVRDNFSHHYEKEIARSQEILMRVKPESPHSLNYILVATDARKSFGELLVLLDLTDAQSAGLTEDERKAISTLLGAVKNLWSLDCIPFEWVEPHRYEIPMSC